MNREQLKASIRDELQSSIFFRSTITYHNLAKAVGLNLFDDKNWDLLNKLLGEISEDGYRQGKPLLSAIVVNKSTKQPGSGFFDTAIRIGALGKHEDRETFWKKQVETLIPQEE